MTYIATEKDGTMFHIMCEDLNVADAYVSDDHEDIIYLLYEPSGIRQPY